MTPRYTNPAHTTIRQNGSDIPVAPGNVDYDALLASGVEIAPYVPPPPTADDVRAEASRRMQALVSARDAAHLSIIITNGIQEVARLNQIKIGVPHPVEGWLVEPREWTLEEKQRLVELHYFDAATVRIRAASNVLEASPPTDYADDKHWNAG